MRELYVKRALYNKNSDLELLKFLDTVSPDLLHEKRGGCIAGYNQPDISMYDLLGHLVYAGIFLYQVIHKKGVVAEYDQELIDFTITNMRPTVPNDYPYYKDLLVKLDDAIVLFAKTMNFDSLDVDDFTQPESAGMLAYTASTWIEHFFTHQIHHRGQISQILSEHNIGHDLSQFRIYAFKY